jgi:NitT/TauT family transport system substrate-binding protein
MPRRVLVLATILVLAAAACGPNGSSQASTCATPPPTGSGGCGSQPDPTAAVTELKVGLGYIPSVQFAPFYFAQQQGYYDDLGLRVTFENKIDPDLVTLVGQGALDLGVADGTSVIPAVSQAIPIRYIATIYGTFPSIVFAKESSGIRTAADLKGRKIGIPGKYGSSWIMLQALLDSAGLKPADATIELYPDFGQGTAVQADAVDAATGFANNEPVQLELSGSKAVVLHVDDVVALPGPGLIAGTATLDRKKDAVTAFVGATLRAMTEIAADPSLGLEAAIKAVPELGKDETTRATQQAILAATIATWSPADGGGSFGTIDEQGWTDSIAYLSKLGLVPNPVTIEDMLRRDIVSPG